jgi:ABC-type polysaccharide/polyol phosphate transport system ATPase subunit
MSGILVGGPSAGSGEIAITCDGVWKSYRNYHQRSHSLKEKVLAKKTRYEEFWVLKGIDLEVPVGGTFGIVGANGSGKSTLLKTMARILTPNKGTVEVRGRISSLLELGIGFHPELTGTENVFLSCSILGFTKRDTEARYDEIVEFAGIEQFMDMPVKNYSTGMYARLAFAVAVTVEPEILVVDEVLSVGDESFQMRCYERIAKFRAEGRTIVLVTHSLEAVRMFCNQAMWLHDGVAKFYGEPIDVITAYLGEVHGHPDDDAATEVPQHQRFGSGEVVVDDLVMVDGSGSATTTPRTGEPLTLRVHYTAHRPVDEAICSIAVYRADSLTYVFGQTTRQAKMPLRLTGQGVIEFAIDEVPFLGGHYFVSVALLDERTLQPFDWHERGYSMMVFDNPAFNAQAGLVRVDGTWNATSEAVTA